MVRVGPATRTTRQTVRASRMEIFATLRNREDGDTIMPFRKSKRRFRITWLFFFESA